MIDESGVVRLRDGDWTAAFRRLDAAGGGIIWVSPGRHDCAPATIDLALFDDLRNNVSIRGGGLGTSVLDFGTGPGNGFTLLHSDGGHQFYTELTGVGFEGERDGVLVQIGRDDCTDAYNSCQFSFSTNNGSPDATAACRLNHVLNTRHYGVHNAAAGTALELTQFQFGGLTGSVSSRLGQSLDFRGYSFANVVEWLNVEACADGVRIADEQCDLNRFGMLYGANVSGTLWRQDAAVQTRIDAAYVGDNVATVGSTTAGDVSLGITNDSPDGFRNP